MGRLVVQMNRNTRRTLHFLSVTGVFMTTFAILYLVQKYTIGLLFSLNDIKVYGFPVHIILYSVIALLFMKRFIKISSPYIDE
ncbi:hypothetical protein [Evansella clarkii]|uniref:hypothetical protein n=1 Tax=Evansella clarkii TaxID=79879 RepID=UPI000B443DD0|nr:hypothetical protein [Evansella clarkii]